MNKNKKELNDLSFTCMNNQSSVFEDRVKKYFHEKMNFIVHARFVEWKHK